MTFVAARAVAAELAGRARVGREAAGLVERDRAHRGVVPERRLRAVAVVGVPVDDGHALDPVRGLRVHGRERGVGEDAAAHAVLGERVMARRPHERVGVVELAREHGVDGREARAGGERRDLVRARPDGREEPGVAVPRRGQLGDALEVGRGVEAQQLLALGRPRAQLDELLAEPAHLDEAADAPHALGRLGVRARLDERGRGHHRRRRAGVVPEHALVEDEASPTHRVASPSSGTGAARRAGRPRLVR